jgi:hypothetical protein
MRALTKSFDLPTSKLDIRRSFTEAEWQHVLQWNKCQNRTPKVITPRTLKVSLSGYQDTTDEFQYGLIWWSVGPVAGLNRSSWFF